MLIFLMFIASTHRPTRVRNKNYHGKFQDFPLEFEMKCCGLELGAHAQTLKRLSWSSGVKSGWSIVLCLRVSGRKYGNNLKFLDGNEVLFPPAKVRLAVFSMAETPH